ncbi:hypothetical protein DVH24_001937 [Malus domestica]|uniref:RRM domain-containing protein n=1 Tax=Malus domestica TaxID=3750 RepID=A0A498I696_MALDO|nr:hypothetical protein DVH24_001937 [Malus domestica]
MNRIQVLHHRDTGKSRGFAFVTMSPIEDCNAVIENLDGCLFVGNLSWSATSESLTKAFQEHGTVVGARVLYDGDTGMSRGYGYVCYSTKSEMDAALESLNGFVCYSSNPSPHILRSIYGWPRTRRKSTACKLGRRKTFIKFGVNLNKGLINGNFNEKHLDVVLLVIS